MRTGSTARGIAVTGVALLALTACGGGGDDEPAATPARRSEAADDADQHLRHRRQHGQRPRRARSGRRARSAGMKGTTPLTELGGGLHRPAARDRPRPRRTSTTPVRPTTPSCIIALAAQMAGTSDATEFAPYVNGVTFGGDKCEDFAACLEIVNGGGQPRLRRRLRSAGLHRRPVSPRQASFGILAVQRRTTLDTTPTEYVIAGDEANAATDEGPGPGRSSRRHRDDPLIIGTLLPQTGNLAFLGPPEVAGAKLAVAGHQRGRRRAGPGRRARSRVTRATPRPTPPPRRSTACCRPTWTPSSVPRRPA